MYVSVYNANHQHCEVPKVAHVQQVIGSRDLQLLVTITHVIVCTHTLKSTKNMGQSVQLMSAKVECSGNGCPPVV